MTATTAPLAGRTGPAAAVQVWGFVRRHVLDVYALLALAYLFLPIGVVVAFSFNNPRGRFNVTRDGFTFSNWTHPFAYPGLQSALEVSIEIALASALVATLLGTLIALALVRYRFRGSATTTPIGRNRYASASSA
jgi:spermidine/putrescine transport system permease protein